MKIRLEPRLTGDRNTTESATFFDVENIFHNVLRREDHGVGDEPILMTLDPPDHFCLGLRRLVMVYHANAAEELQEHLNASNTVLL